MKKMGLWCQSEKSLSSLLPTHYHQHSDGSDSKESVGGGFGDCASGGCYTKNRTAITIVHIPIIIPNNYRIVCGSVLIQPHCVGIVGVACSKDNSIIVRL